MEVIDAAIGTIDVPKDYKSQFPVPYTEEQIRKDIVSLFLIPFRHITLITDGMLEAVGTRYLCDYIKSPDLDPSDDLILDSDDGINLKYEDVEESMLAETMMSIYRYAYYGIDIGGGELSTDSSMNWYALWIQDMAKSEFNYEWNPQNEVRTAARRCYEAVKIANLRAILEGHEGFLSHEEDEAFSISDMALLSGMEEISVRAAANPKRANPLATFKYKDGSTTVSLKEAKRWLISKKRYVPIKDDDYEIKEVDFDSLKVKGIKDLQRALLKTYLYKKSKGEINQQVNETISKLGYNIENLSIELQLVESKPETLCQLAIALDVDEVIFNLRLREVIARKLLQDAESELEKIRNLRIKNKK